MVHETGRGADMRSRLPDMAVTAFGSYADALKSHPRRLPDQIGGNPLLSAEPRQDLGQDHLDVASGLAVRSQATRDGRVASFGQVAGQAVGHSLDDGFMEIHAVAP